MLLGTSTILILVEEFSAVVAVTVTLVRKISSSAPMISILISILVLKPETLNLFAAVVAVTVALVRKISSGSRLSLWPLNPNLDDLPFLEACPYTLSHLPPAPQTVGFSYVLFPKPLSIVHVLILKLK